MFNFITVDMAVPRLVHSTCTSSAPALEMHSAQVLEMLVQMQCPRSVQVLQEMLRIQEGVTEQLCKGASPNYFFQNNVILTFKVGGG